MLYRNSSRANSQTFIQSRQKKYAAPTPTTPNRIEGLIAGMKMPPSASSAVTPKPNTELPMTGEPTGGDRRFRRDRMILIRGFHFRPAVFVRAFWERHLNRRLNSKASRVPAVIQRRSEGRCAKAQGFTNEARETLAAPVGQALLRDG
jgi:hypothetical protein